MAKYKSKAVREYMRKVADLNCICCGVEAELHHPRFNFGLSQRANDMDVIPLCPRHQDLEKTLFILVKNYLFKSLVLNKNYKKSKRRGRNRIFLAFRSVWKHPALKMLLSLLYGYTLYLTHHIKRRNLNF
ncbi:MAG: hypothetical protein CM15mV87_180 [Caudoviricetes sp.]|nr:MAG: hypothetical protein CM15mV87_180 [Caudoviricetes sp.]